MGPPPTPPIEIDQPDAARAPALFRYFNKATAKLLLAALILPNILTLATFLSVVDIGLPPRTFAIILYVVVAIGARWIPFALTVTLFLGVLALDMVWTISLTFGLAPGELLVALEHAKRLHPFSSPFYVGLIATICVTTIVSLALLARRKTITQGNIYLLFPAVVALACIDLEMNTSTHFNYNAMNGRGRPMTSAAEVSGFRAVAGTNGRNVVVVLVESFGYLVDPEARARIAAPLKDPRIAGKYVVTSGQAEYFGSTTSGEMRELCNTRTPYEEFASHSGANCLPSKLRSEGYSTLAIHGFSSGMFERKDWYPEIGFSKAVFGDELLLRLPRRCGNAFRSVCDADLPPLIAKEAAKMSGPRFIYWLTLNTHIPVSPGDALANFGCTGARPEFKPRAVCRMVELWYDVFASAAKLAVDPVIAPAEILVVGDHAPPLWSRRGRSHFAPGQVAWYRLTPR
jgi:hypothetical protein